MLSWRKPNDAENVSLTAGQYERVVRALPRRKISHSASDAHVSLPLARRVRFSAGTLRTVSRLFVWLWSLIRFYSGNFFDFVRRRGTEERRAIRLRQVFEDAGPTFAKLGQQLSMRADMLPYSYCLELAGMLDRAPSFPVEQAIAIVERSLKRPLYDVFEAFDPEPIGSASLACVYQAQIGTGEHVAVKVRRPGHGTVDRCRPACRRLAARHC